MPAHRTSALPVKAPSNLSEGAIRIDPNEREEIFKGEFADRAPDIMMVPAEGYSLAHAKSPIEDADWVSGDHRLEGTIVAWVRT